MQATAAPATASDAEVAEGLYAVLHYLMKSSGRETFQTMADADLTLTTYKTLHVLDDRDEGDDVCVKQLAEELVLSLAAASRVVDGLHQRGYVERREDEHDRRMKRVGITARRPRGDRPRRRHASRRRAAVRELAERRRAQAPGRRARAAGCSGRRSPPACTEEVAS